MVVVPGFSVSDLISAVNWTIKFIIEVSQARDQVQDLLKDLETSRDQLKGLEEVLETAHHGIEHRAAAFQALQTELHEILNDSVNLLKRFHPNAESSTGFLSNVRHNFRWIVDGKYQGTVKSLQERISKNERRIDRELLLSIRHHQNLREPSNEPVSSVSGSQHLVVASPSWDKETRSTPLSVSSSLPTIPEQLVSTTSNPHAGQAGSQLWAAITGPPSPPPSPPLPSRLQDYGSTSDINCQRLDEAARPVLPPSVCDLSIDVLPYPQSIRRSSTTPCGPSQFTQELFSKIGIVKVWFGYGDPERLQPHTIQSIMILRDESRCFRGLKMVRADGKILKDEISPYWNNVTKHPFPVHAREARDVRDADGQARNCIRFQQDRKGTTVPRYYSFSSDEDYRQFQSDIVGKTLVFWAEVKQITTAWSKTTPVCEKQVLQVWQSDGIKSIQFFRNGKDRVYSQHSASSLQIKEKSSSKLKLVFVLEPGTPTPGSVAEQEQIMKHLLIEFTNPRDTTTFFEKAELRHWQK